jgi:hypothetical protein
LDPAFVRNLGQAGGRVTGQRVACGNQQPQRVRDKRDIGARAGGGPPAARRRSGVEVVNERQIGSAVPDRRQRLIGLGLDHRDLDRVADRRRHRGQRRREQRLPGTGKGDHGQGLRPVRGQGTQPLRSQLQFGVDRVGRGEQGPAGVGEDYAPGAAFDEHAAGSSLEGGNLLRHRRRRVVQRRGGSGEAARARDFSQHSEAMHVDQQFS